MVTTSACLRIIIGLLGLGTLSVGEVVVDDQQCSQDGHCLDSSRRSSDHAADHAMLQRDLKKFRRAVAAQAEAADQTTSNVAFRLLQWNVNWQNKNAAGLASVIMANNPSIIGLCELTLPVQGMAQALAAASGRPFKSQPRGSSWCGYGTDIFYDSAQWEALEGGAEASNCASSRGGPRAANWVVLQHRSTGSKLITGGTHTSYCRLGCDDLHACELGHMYQKFEAMKHKYGDAPVLWMGDLNRNMHTHVMQNLLRGVAGLKSTFSVVDLARTHGNTYFSGGSAIDHILGEAVFHFKHGGRTSQGITGQLLMGADHFPIFADVQMPAVHEGFIERAFVAVEGTSVGDLFGVDVEKCKQACSGNWGCRSFTWYTGGNCHLKDKVVTVGEQASARADAGNYKTYYKA